MLFVKNYRSYEIYRTHEGTFSVMVDTPDGILPCVKGLSSLEEATSIIDNKLCFK